jgi:hypothetical protein
MSFVPKTSTPGLSGNSTAPLSCLLLASFRSGQQQVLRELVLYTERTENAKYPPKIKILICGLGLTPAVSVVRDG